MAPWRHSAEYTVCALLLLALAGAARAPGHETVKIYGSKGSTVLIPGVEIELKGNGVLQWTVEKMGGAGPVTILSYHYRSPEAEMQQEYEHRVNLSFTNGSLQLFNVSIQDSGRYTLNLIFEKITFVHELGVPEPVSEIEVAMVSSTRECSVLLRCKASGDVMNMTWKSNGSELIQNVTRVGYISELTVKVDSSGNYTCVAWNPVSELEKTYQLVLDSTVDLPIIGFLIAAFTFIILTGICWTPFLMDKFRCCHNEKTDAAAQLSEHASWVFFLICTLTSASIAQSARVADPSLVPFGYPEFNVFYLVILTSCLVLDVLLFLICRRKILLKRCSRLKEPVTPQKNTISLPDEDQEGKCWLKHVGGALKTVNIILRVATPVLFVSTMIYYFQTYFTACHQPHDFALTIVLSVLVPVMIIALIYGSCCYFCDGAATGFLDDNRPPESMEMKVNAVKEPLEIPRYVEVPAEEEFAVP